MYQKIKKAIEDFNTIVIYRHSRPDGDALGSQGGLANIILQNYKDKTVYVVGDMSDKYTFMNTMDNLSDDFDYESTLGIVLDCSECSLVSNQNFKRSKMIIKMDHHIRREDFGDIDLVDTSFESACGIVCDFAFQTGLVINSLAAGLLYTGIVTDSGRFRYDMTTSRTFEICSKLLKCNFDMQKIYDNLYTEDLQSVLLRARYTLKMQFSNPKVAYICNTLEDVLKEDVDIFTISRSVVNCMSGIKGIEIWANFTADPQTNLILCEFRSTNININPIAVKYGGGGHAKACGASVKSWLDVESILRDFDELIGENNV